MEDDVYSRYSGLERSLIILLYSVLFESIRLPLSQYMNRPLFELSHRETKRTEQTFFPSWPAQWKAFCATGHFTDRVILSCLTETLACL